MASLVNLGGRRDGRKQGAGGAEGRILLRLDCLPASGADAETTGTAALSKLAGRSTDTGGFGALGLVIEGQINS